MVPIKNHIELEKMRMVGGLVARICGRIVDYIGPGMTTAEIDGFAACLMADSGVKSAFLGYRGYPASICVSVNDEVVHGVPGRRIIRLGDIVSLDVGIVKDSFYGDMAKTVVIGTVDSRTLELVNITEKALYAGIAKAVAGNRLSDISHAIEKCARQAGFSVVQQFVGHGIGRSMHEEPQILNFGPPGKGPELKEGMTLAIEPMVNMGVAGVKVLRDGWTAVTCDRKPSAHFEHTVAVGAEKAEILTC